MWKLVKCQLTHLRFNRRHSNILFGFPSKITMLLSSSLYILSDFLMLRLSWSTTNSTWQQRHFWFGSERLLCFTSCICGNNTQETELEPKKTSDPLTLKDPCISESCIEIKIKLNLYFHTSLWCLKRFYEGLKGLHETFWGTTKKCENKNLT